MSSWRICWSGKQEPGEANIDAPGTTFDYDVGDEW